MKFKVKFNESAIEHTIKADTKEDFVKYMSEHINKISEISRIDESVKITDSLVMMAWNELKRRARKNHYISTQALESICYKYAQSDDWDSKGVDKFAYDKLWDLLIDKMDAENYELLEADEYDKKFDLPKAPQTSMDVIMNNMRKSNNQSL